MDQSLGEMDQPLGQVDQLLGQVNGVLVTRKSRNIMVSGVTIKTKSPSEAWTVLNTMLEEVARDLTKDITKKSSVH